MLIIESWLKKHGKEQHRSWEERFNRHQGGLSYFPDSTGLVIAKIAILIGFYTFISESRSRHFFFSYVILIDRIRNLIQSIDFVLDISFFHFLIGTL